MKKILFILFLLIPINAFCGLITYDTSVTGSSFTEGYLKNAISNAYNTINGSINTDNLATGAVTSDDISTPANPLVRENELIGEMVYSGLTIATSATLASTITAGIAYIENDGDNTLHRVVTNDTAKTFTASRDTYVYLDYAGAFTYTAVLNGAATPATPSNSIIIAKVVTSAGAITSVTDYRQTTPTNLRIYNNYRTGYILSRDITTTTKVSIDAGELEFGAANGSYRINSSPVYVDFTTNGRGGLDVGSLASGYYYIFAVADDDTSTQWETIASLSKTNAAGVTGEKLIGWCYATTASNVSPDCVGAYRKLGGDSPNIFTTEVENTVVSAGAAPVTLYTAKYYSSGRPLKISYGMHGVNAAAVESFWTSVSIDSATNVASQFAGIAGNSPYQGGLSKVWIVETPEGTHNIDLKFSSQTTDVFTLNGFYFYIEEL